MPILTAGVGGATGAVNAAGKVLSGGGGVGGGVGGAVGSRPVPQPPTDQGSGTGGFVSQQANQQRGYESPTFGPPSMPVSGPPTMPVRSAITSGVRGAVGSAGRVASTPPPNPYLNPFNAASQFVTANYAPQFGALQGQQGITAGMIPMIGGNFDAQRRYAQGDYASNLAMNNLSGRGIGIDRQDLGTQRSRVGLDMAGRNIDRSYIGNMSGIADQALANQLAGVDADLATTTRGINSDYTSRGAWFAPFRGLENQDAAGAAERRRTDLNLGRQGQQAGWDRDLANLDLGDQRSQLDYQDLGSAEQRLDLEAERLGIQRSDLERMFQQGMEQLGYDQSMSYMDLIGQLNSGNAQQAQLAAQQLQDILMYGGMFAQDPAMMQVLGNSLAGAQGRVPGGVGTQSTGY